MNRPFTVRRKNYGPIPINTSCSWFVNRIHGENLDDRKDKYKQTYGLSLCTGCSCYLADYPCSSKKQKRKEQNAWSDEYHCRRLIKDKYKHWGELTFRVTRKIVEDDPSDDESLESLSKPSPGSNVVDGGYEDSTECDPNSFQAVLNGTDARRASSAISIGMKKIHMKQKEEVKVLETENERL